CTHPVSRSMPPPLSRGDLRSKAEERSGARRSVPRSDASRPGCSFSALTDNLQRTTYHGSYALEAIVPEN
ncbi:MAG: hypothetical protein ACP5FY_07460, partial [Kosmotogaceae bacterium]